MDRAIIERHLALADRHVAEGERHLTKQRALIRKLERDGHGTRAARLFLKSLQEMQSMHLADRRRLRAELRAAAAAPRAQHSVAFTRSAGA